MMGYAVHFSFCDLAAPDVESFVDLPRIGGDDLAANPFGKRNRIIGFAGGSGAADDDYFREGRHGAILA